MIFWGRISKLIISPLFEKRGVLNLENFIMFLTRTYAYQRVRTVSFSENFARVLNGSPLSNEE